MIGLDRVAGYFDARVVDQWAAAGRRPARCRRSRSATCASRWRTAPSRWSTCATTTSGRQATSRARGTSRSGISAIAWMTIPKTKPIVVQCAAGARSSIGASLLQARGVEQVINLIGGIGDWSKAGLPTVELRRDGYDRVR